MPDLLASPITFRTRFILTGADRSEVGAEPHDFRVPHRDGAVEVAVSRQAHPRVPDVQVTLLTASGQALVSHALAALLAASVRVSDYDSVSRAERDAIGRRIGSGARAVAAMLKYLLENEVISEALIGHVDAHWRSSGDWVSFEPSTSVEFLGTGGASFKLDERSAARIQRYLDEGRSPLLALRHLHRAIREHNPRARWIEATIAAELAVKEVLARKEPSLRSLLIELPSPPLDVLYGRVLEAYLGEKSPFRRQLSEGAAVRNKLVHRIEDFHVSNDQAREYLQDVRDAIAHLQAILDPDDEMAVRAYRWVQSRRTALGRQKS